MRRILIITLSLIVLGASSCLKDTPATDLSHEGSIIEVIYPAGASFNGVGSGLEYFGGGALSYPSTDAADTLTFYVNIAGTNTLNKPLQITIAPNTSALEDNYSTDSITYVAMPDSDYTILNPTKTIPAGSRMDTFQVVFYPSKFDITKNFMLALAPSNNGGLPTAGNFGILYLHTIGNPLAGIYTETGTRYNYNGSSGWSGTGPYPAPASTADLSADGGTATLDNTTTIELPYSNLGASGDNLIISYTASGPSISVTGNKTLVGGVSNFKVWVQTISINATTGKATIHIVTSYTNGAGNDRINDETFVQQ